MTLWEEIFKDVFKRLSDADTELDEAIEYAMMAADRVQGAVDVHDAKLAARLPDKLPKAAPDMEEPDDIPF